jgi:hypothetical protein
MFESMTGEYLFSMFCLLWLVFGSVALALRVADGLQRVELVRKAQRAEEEMEEAVKEQTEGRETIVKDLEVGVDARRKEASLIEAKISGLDQATPPIIRITGREAPKPSENLWLARLTDPTLGPKQRYIGAWAEDPAYARAKVLVSLGDGEGMRLGDFSLFAMLKKTMFDQDDRTDVSSQRLSSDLQDIPTADVPDHAPDPAASQPAATLAG